MPGFFVFGHACSSGMRVQTLLFSAQQKAGKK
jgi:hypothetical protein